MEHETREAAARRGVARRIVGAAAAAAMLLSTGMAAGPVAAQDASFDPMKYAGSTVRIALVDGERDDKCIIDREAEIEASTGIDIQLTTMALPALVEAVNQNINAPESAFDIVHMLGFDLAGVVGSGRLERLNDYVTDPARTPADYDFADFPEGQLHYTGYFDVAAGEFGGDDLYVIPGIHSGSAMLFYRKDLLEAAGIPAPTTWAEYLEAAKALTKDGVYGNINTGNTTDPTLFLIDWYTRFITMGGQLTSGSKADKTLRTNFDSPEAIAALQNLIDLLPYSPEGIPTYGFGEALPLFATGKVAMWPTWATIAGYLFNPEQSLVADKVAVAPMPADDGNPRAVRGGWGLGIPTNIPQANKDAAWHILTYITSKAHEKCQVMNYQTDPNRTSTGTDPEILAKYPYIKEAVAAIESAQTLEIANLPQSFQIITEVAREMNLALAGSQDAATAMKNAQAAALKILKDGGHLAE